MSTNFFQKATLAILVCMGLHGIGGAASIDRPPAADSPLAKPYDLAKDAPVLIVLGQSNAVGWTNPMDGAERKNCTYLSNVRGLNYNSNHSLTMTDVIWDNFSCGDHNLASGGYNSGWAYHLAGEFAKRWQAQITASARDPKLIKLPDLYVIQIAWGGQGFRPEDGAENRWWIDRNRSDIDSLHPFTQRVLALAFQNLIKAGKNPRVIGLHWNQWETENQSGWMTSSDDVRNTFAHFLGTFRTTLGNADFPIYLYRPRSTIYTRSFWSNDATKFNHIVSGLTNLAQDTSSTNNFRLIDPADAVDGNGNALYKASLPHQFGIFSSDTVHYNKAVQEWFAKKQWDLIFTSKLYGGAVTSVVMPSAPNPTLASSTQFRRNAPDFGGDHRGDLLFNNGTGSYILWEMDKTSVRGSVFGKTMPTDWHVVAQDDFTGDGKADVVWHQKGTTNYKLWTMDGHSLLHEAALSMAPAPGWQVIASADFDADGKADLLWKRDGEDRYVVWLMNGASVRTGEQLNKPAAGWTIKAVADFNGDRKADILWINASSNNYAVWYLDGVKRATSGGDGRIPDPALGWYAAAVDDFDGDGKADILWNNPSTGAYVIWHMNGISVRNGINVTTPAPGWAVHSTGDFDGDKKADLLWYNKTTNNYVIWLLKGTGFEQKPGSGYIQQPASGWSIVK
jgi:FG-GAP-like repeat